MAIKTTRTTVILENELLKRVRSLAKKHQVTIKEIIQDALVEYINKPTKSQKTSYKFEPIVKKGTLIAGVDIDDRDSLYQRMDGGS